jgi:hypothetical protein
MMSVCDNMGNYYSMMRSYWCNNPINPSYENLAFLRVFFSGLIEKCCAALKSVLLRLVFSNIVLSKSQWLKDAPERSASEKLASWMRQLLKVVF